MTAEHCYICGYFAVAAICVVDFESLTPIVDSSFDVTIFVVPTDTSESGNQRFVKGFKIDSVKIVSPSDSATLSVLECQSDSVEHWHSYNRKRLEFWRASGSFPHMSRT